MADRSIPSYSNKDLKKVFDALSEIENFKITPEHELFVLIREIRTALSIHTKNFTDLKKALNYHNHGNIESQLWHSSSDFRFRLQKTIIRLLMNHLSSIFFIVDFSRYRLKPIIDQNPAIRKHLEERLSKEFKNNSLHRFLQELRNYTTHCTFPKIASSSSFNPKSKQAFKTTLYLRKQELLQNFGWQPVARQYLDTCSEEIEVAQLITTHYDNFMQFQRWLFLLLLINDKSKTEAMIKRVASLAEYWDDGTNTNAYPYTKSFLRYIQWAYKKASALEKNPT